MSCESDQGFLQFPTCYKGGTLESFDIAIAEENGVALSSASIIFKDSDGVAVLTLTSGDGLTLDDTTAGAWNITIDAISPITLDAGTYYYSLKTTDVSGTIKFYLAGNWKIIEP